MQLVAAAGWNVKSPSASMVTLPPSFVANVPAVTVRGPGPSTSVSPARMSPEITFLGFDRLGAPSSGSLTIRVVLPIAPSLPVEGLVVGDGGTVGGVISMFLVAGLESTAPSSGPKSTAFEAGGLLFVLWNLTERRAAW